jgi:hypothetical protein
LPGISETMSQNKSFFFISWLSQVFVIVMEACLAHCIMWSLKSHMCYIDQKKFHNTSKNSLGHMFYSDLESWDVDIITHHG